MERGEALLSLILWCIDGLTRSSASTMLPQFVLQDLVPQAVVGVDLDGMD